MTSRRGFRVLSVLPAAVLAAGLVLAAGAAMAAPQPSFRGLGFLPMESESAAFAVSADGRVVVGECPSGERAFRWKAEEGMTDLLNAEGYWLYHARALGVSADGSVIVGREGHGGDEGMRPFRWTDTAPPHQFEPLPGGDTGGVASSLSADGSIVVGGLKVLEPGSVGTQAFRWTVEGGTEGLGYLDDTDLRWSQAYGVTPDGSVVVGASTSAEGQQAFRWTAETGMVGLGDLAAGPWSWTTARAVSADGRVVVGGGDTELGILAFRWTEAEGMVGLGDLPGGDFYSSASGVSADGTRVVGASHSAAGREAFLWTPEGGMQSLNDVLAQDYGLDLSGWFLESVTAISPDGFTIVGAGTNPDGHQEAWIATIPEPGALALLALGVVALLKGARCHRRAAGASGTLAGPYGSTLRSDKPPVAPGARRSRL